MSTDNNPSTVSAPMPAQEAEGSDKKDSGFRSFVSKYGIFLIFLGMCLLLAIITIDNGVSIFLKYRNIVNVLRQSSVIGIIACGHS